VRGVLVGRELRVHGVAGSSAELRRLHVLDRPIRDLSSNQEVSRGGGTEKPSQAPERGLAVEGNVGQPLLNLAPAQVDTDRNKGQAAKKNDRENQKEHDPDIGIVDVAANLRGKHKEPGDSCRSHQGYAEQAQPMASKQEPNRSIGCKVHALAWERMRRQEILGHPDDGRDWQKLQFFAV